MKLKVILSILALSLLCSAALAQSVVVTGKKVTYKRPKPIMDSKKSFWVNHPRIKASNAALSRKIETAISFEKVIPLNIREEINEVQWLEEADFEVNYNKNGVLCVTLSVMGTGAYPSGSSKRVVVDTLTGRRVRTVDLFVNLTGLAARLRQEQKKEIDQAVIDIRRDPDAGETDPAELFRLSRVTIKDLNEFVITDDGVRFYYDYGFPHVIQALQPDGEYFLTWAQLKPYMRRGGLLTRIAR